MAPKGKSNQGKAKAKSTDDEGPPSSKLKPANSINVRHILVRSQYNIELDLTEASGVVRKILSQGRSSREASIGR